jgi:hypothetical protein
MRVTEGHFDQKRQYLSFTAGKDNVPPDPLDYALHVVAGDTFLYEISGGFPEAPDEPFVTDPIVYPSSDYWQTLLNGERERPYIDISISEHNTLRVPSAVHEYDVYADKGKFYEDVEIDGGLKIGGMVLGGATDDIVISGDLSCDAVNCDEVTANVINNAVSKTRIAIKDITADYTLTNEDSGSVLHSKPTSGTINLTLPNDLKEGVAFTVANLLEGKTTTLPATLKARGNVLSEPYSAATIYFDGTDWYGFGDLV